MFFNTDQWAKASSFLKALHVTMFVSVILLWIVVIARAIRDMEEFSLAPIVDPISKCLGGYLVFFSFLQLNYHRDTLTECIRVLNKMCLSVPIVSERNREWKQGLRRSFVLEAKLLFLSMTMGFFAGTPLTVQALMSGKLAYATIIPLSDESYTFGWWLQFVYQSAVTLISGVFFSGVEFLRIGMLYYWSLLMRFHSENILDLFQDPDFDPETEERKMCKIFREVEELME